jgi:flagellar basal body-associated protein FliL
MDEKQGRRNKIINISLIVLLIVFITFRVATACNMLE